MFGSSAANQLCQDDSSARDPAVDAARYEAMARLMESLLHDVRNPLNALAINAEVLVEKLKDESGRIPAGPEKNLRAIREQVQRVDAVLRQFAQFIAPPAGGADCHLTELVQKAVEVLGHESRRSRVKVVTRLAEDLRVRVSDLSALSFLVFRPLLAAIERSPAGAEVIVALSREGGRAVLTISDSGGAQVPRPDAWAVFEPLAHKLAAELRLREGELRLAVPLD